MTNTESFASAVFADLIFRGYVSTAQGLFALSYSSGRVEVEILDRVTGSVRVSAATASGEDVFEETVYTSNTSSEDDYLEQVSDVLSAAYEVLR